MNWRMLPKNLLKNSDLKITERKTLANDLKFANILPFPYKNVALYSISIVQRSLNQKVRWYFLVKDEAGSKWPPVHMV